MALINCPDCGREVSDQAPACPNCGRPIKATQTSPAKHPTTTKKNPGCGTAIVMLIAAFIIFALVRACSDDNQPAPATPQDQAAAAAAAKEKADKEANCDKDLTCAGERSLIDASVYCKDAIEHEAKHSVKWTASTFEPIMSRYRWAGKGPGGNIVFVGDKVEFQNGFGAFTPVVYACEWDPKNKKPVNVVVEEGRLPVR